MSLSRKIARQKILLLMLLPWVVWVLMFSYGPLWGWILAFMNFRPGIPVFNSPWVGFAHFQRFFNSVEFFRVMRNTLVVNILSLAIAMPLEISLAILIYELRFKKFKRIVQTISYLPFFISWAIVGGIAFQLLSLGGVLNDFLLWLGVIDSPIMFLGLPGAGWPILIISRIWKNLGWSTIVYLGALGGVDPALYEAAYVDGAGRWQRIKHVTIPGIVPTITVMLILSAGALIGGAFDQVIVFQNAINMVRVDTIDTMVYRTGLQQGALSYATAVGIFNTVCSLILLLSVNAMIRRINGRSIF